MNVVPLEQVDFESLARLVKSKFRVSAGAAGALELELSEATPQRISPAGNGKQCESFSLFFLGPLERPLPQGSYRLQCDTLGAFDLFLVPNGRDMTRIRYEAAFNRLR